MSGKKIVIEPNTVQETLVFPLFGRKYCYEKYPDLFEDKECCRVLDRIDYKPQAFMKEFACVAAATRQYDLICEIKEYLKDHPKATIVNLGCGLDATFEQVDNGQIKCYNLDLPDVIDIRNELMPPREREFNLAYDLNNSDWYSKIDFKEEDGIIFFAGGVFYFFSYEAVQKIVTDMAEHFKGGVLVFDFTNSFGFKIIQKSLLHDMKNVKASFYFKDAEKEMMSWTSNITKVQIKKYNTDYRPIDKRFTFASKVILNLLEWVKYTQIAIVSFK